jgi:uncharacterized protein (TIGR00645 family)
LTSRTDKTQFTVLSMIKERVTPSCLRQQQTTVCRRSLFIGRRFRRNLEARDKCPLEISMPNTGEQDRFHIIRWSLLRGSRWAMAPFCLGLMVALLLVLAQFFRELAHAIAEFGGMVGSDVILAVLKLADLVFVANLLVLIIAAGVELFIPRASDVAHEESFGLSSVEFAILKLRVVASITAIATIDLLEDFINIDQTDKTGVLWQIAILLTFVVSGVLLALMDRLSTIRH